MTLASLNSEFETDDQPFLCPDCGARTQPIEGNKTRGIEFCRPCDWLIGVVHPQPQNASDRGPDG